MMRASRIASLVGGRLVGPDVEVSGVKGYHEAGIGDLSFVFSPSVLKSPTGASVLVVPEAVGPVEGKSCILVDDPMEAAIKIASLFFKEEFGEGISAKAVVYPTARIGKGVVVREFAVVERDAVLEDNVVVMPFAFVGAGSVIGEGTVLFPGVVIYPGTRVGKRCRIHSGAVIGADGFGYVERDGKRVKIPQVGRVVIGDDVEIGANTCIDRATFGETVVGEGTKIDNLVQIGHNCRIGRHCAFAGQVGISGSVVVGDRVLMGGQAGIADHAVIGSDVKVAAKAGVFGRVADGEVIVGAPAMSAAKWKRIQGIISRLPEIYSLFRKLKRERDA